MQSLLGCVSRPTKVALGKVGIFSVASLHAMVSARQGSSSGATGSSSGHGRKKTSALSVSYYGLHTYVYMYIMDTQFILAAYEGKVP